MRWRWWAAAAGLVALGVAVAGFNAGEWVDLQRAWVQSHPLANGRVPVELLIDDGARVAIVVFATLFALLASIPALVIVSLLARRAGRSAGEAILAAALTWPVFAILASRTQEVVASLLGVGGDTSVLNVLTPPVEELLLLLCAAIVLLIRPPRGVRPAIAIGLAAGIGMNVWETALYLQARGILSYLPGDEASQWTIVAVRAALGGFGLHAVTAALSTMGLAISLARPPGSRRFVPAVLAFIGAVAVHGAWNATATPLINRLLFAIGGPQPGDSPLAAFVAASLGALPYLVVPVAILLIAWRRAGRPIDEPVPDPRLVEVEAAATGTGPIRW